MEHPQRHYGKKMTTRINVGGQLCSSFVTQTHRRTTYEGIHAPIPGLATVVDPGPVAAHRVPPKRSGME